MPKVFEMTDLGEIMFFLRMEITQSCEGIFLFQKRYALSLLKGLSLTSAELLQLRFFVNEKLMKDDGEEREVPKVYRSLIGSLLYLTSSRCSLSVWYLNVC